MSSSRGASVTRGRLPGQPSQPFSSSLWRREVWAGRECAAEDGFGGAGVGLFLHWILVTASWMEVAT